MLEKKMLYLFAAITVAALLLMARNFYLSHAFDTNALSSEIMHQIETKEREIIVKIREHYGIDFQVPLIISEKMPSRLYGMAVLDTKGAIRVYLNKKRMKESLKYILDDVMAHEYAHALMFSLGESRSRNDGHTKAWQEACLKLGGSRCDRFVNHQDVIYGKIGF